MVKIYVNDRIIYIGAPEDILTSCEVVLNIEPPVNAVLLKEIIVSFEENIHTRTIALQGSKPEAIWTVFQSIYKMMHASGGLVVNDSKDLLMIYRNDRWDLPKGKIEPGEDPETAAVREVKEECGVTDISILKEAAMTFHTYPYGSERILKCTYWFHMLCKDPEHTSPQTEEGITEVKWMNGENLRHAAMHSYASIIHLLRQENILK